jgi:hypothetical protein
MAELLALPDEVFVDNVIYLQYDRAALYNLCLISHRFHYLTREIIFRLTTLSIQA